MNRRDKAFTDHVARIVGARARFCLLTVELHIKVAQLFAHRVVYGTCSRAEGFFVSVTVRAWQVLLLFLEDLIDVQLLHCGPRNAEGVRERPLFCLTVDILRRFDFADTTLVFFVFLVAKAIFLDAKSSTKGLVASEFLLNLITKGVGGRLGRGEARCLAKGKLLL